MQPLVGTAMITAKELSFQYSTGKAPVLNTINLTVDRGELPALRPAHPA